MDTPRLRHRIHNFRQIVALALFLATLPAFADGIKLPVRAVQQIPAIPSQRALIVFRDGVEQLTIESNFNGSGDRFGWIVPLPATPTSIEEGSSGCIDTLAAVLQPRIISYSITDGRSVLYAMVLAFAGIVTFWAGGLLVLSRSRHDAIVSLISNSVAGALLIVAFFLLLHFAGVTAGSAAGISNHRQSRWYEEGP